jgi:hypothetical protein
VRRNGTACGLTIRVTRDMATSLWTYPHNSLSRLRERELWGGGELPRARRVRVYICVETRGYSNPPRLCAGHPLPSRERLLRRHPEQPALPVIRSLIRRRFA